MCNLNCRRRNFDERASVEKFPRTRTRNKKGNTLTNIRTLKPTFLSGLRL